MSSRIKNGDRPVRKPHDPEQSKRFLGAAKEAEADDDTQGRALTLRSERS